MRNNKGQFVKGHKVPQDWKDKKSVRCLGFKHSEKTKKKIGESNKGKHFYWLGKKKPHLEKTKIKIGKANKISQLGNKKTDITKLKMSKAKIGKNNPMYGKSVSQETRKKISDAKRGING